jgi:hypothetical protein
MCERIHPENWHLKRFAPFCLAGLLVSAACGAPDEVKRASVTSGGQIGGSTGGAGSGGSSASSTSAPGGSTSAGAVSTSSASGGKTSSGGSPATAGNGGSSSSSKGGSSSGAAGAGSTSTSKSSGGAGSTGGSSSYPPVGGTTGGTTSATTGGTAGGGGTSATTTSTSTTPAPTSGLAVNVTKPITGATGAITFNQIVIENRNAESADLSSVTMRYWYQDEGFSTSPELAVYYVSIGNAGGGKLADAKVATASPAAAGADHYFEFSMSGTLAAQNDKSGNDKFNLQFALHTKSYSEKVDLTNDYSYNAGATGYNEKITLHGGGKVIWGTPPGGGGAAAGGGGGDTPSPDAGAPDATAAH